MNENISNDTYDSPDAHTSETMFLSGLSNAVNVEDGREIGLLRSNEGSNDITKIDYVRYDVRYHIRNLDHISVIY